MGAALVCLLGVGSIRAQGGRRNGGAPDHDKLFRNIQVLKGMPIDTFFDAMGMFAASMGDDCTYCHSKDAVFRHEAFGDPTPRIQKARQMIVMMQALNKQYFGGQPRVTCFTCHRGSYSPVNAPRLSLQYGAPDDDPNVIDFPTNTRMTADQIFEQYLKAIGGPGALVEGDEPRREGHLLRIRHRPRRSAGRDLRQGAESADLDHPHVQRRQLPGLRRPQRLVRRSRQSGADRRRW